MIHFFFLCSKFFLRRMGKYGISCKFFFGYVFWIEWENMGFLFLNILLLALN